ncbi:hypothetical protein [Massilia haematophila]|uniref:Uncharacterized protein n=1 Tax=Massilia haematophila TaxID=457923 RepID=A0ABV7PMC1_9BURK
MMADNKDLSPGAGAQGGDAGNRGGDVGSGLGNGQGLDRLAGPAAGSVNSQEAGAGAMSGQYTGGAGAGTTRESGIISASPESNVGPAGAPQSSRGSATGPIPGGTSGAAGAGDSVQNGMGGAAGGGNPGTLAQTAPEQDRQDATKDASGESAVQRLAEKDEGGVGGADSR